MSLNRLRRHYHERRLHLITTLQDKGKKLTLSNQHQIYGAVKEIENFIKSIDQEIDEAAKGDFELSSDGPEPFHERIVIGIRAAGSGTKGFFKNIYTFCIGGTKDAISSTKERIELYREVREEVKKRKN